MCKIEKHIEEFYKQYTECKNFSSIRSLKRYYDYKDEISNQRKINYEKKETITKTKWQIYRFLKITQILC